MAVFTFAEHPHEDKRSHSNTIKENPDQTEYWTVGTFDERVTLLNTAVVGREYALTCYPRSWEETTKNGKTKTVKGLFLLNIEPFIKEKRRKNR